MKLFLRLSLNDCEGEKAWGKNRGRLIVVTLMLTEQLVRKSAGSCSEASGHSTEVLEGRKADSISKQDQLLIMAPWENGFTVRTLLPINGGRGDVSRGGLDYPGSTACPSPLVSNWISLNVWIFISNQHNVLGVEITRGDTRPERHTVLLLSLSGIEWVWKKCRFPPSLSSCLKIEFVLVQLGFNYSCTRKQVDLWYIIIIV